MKFQHIVVLTGAGISAESGIKTFRDSNGLWENHAIEDVATPEGFKRNPSLVYQFYNTRRNQLVETNVAPNAAHMALVQLEQEYTDRFMLVTQNVDNLHERAGSQNIRHMHGELLRARCINSGKSVETYTDFNESLRCTCCLPANKMRPDIVWFGEMPYYMDEIEEALFRCNLFVAIGTSGNVYPAAGFVELARQSGAHTVELNLEPSTGTNRFAEHHYGLASVIVPRFFNTIFD
jgi:NAD-dependent deacetylase